MHVLTVVSTLFDSVIRCKLLSVLVIYISALRKHWFMLEANLKGFKGGTSV